VLRRLVGDGYRVTPQVKVGAYRIDMVVDGDDKRLVVECDGDRYHTIEQLPFDMERQAILERLGWTFVRVRGSAFFRDPDAALAPVFARLQELEISQLGVSPVEASMLPATADDEANSDSLLNRVKRRAAELRREWAARPDDEGKAVDWPAPAPARLLPRPTPPTPVPMPSPPPEPRPPTPRPQPPKRPTPDRRSAFDLRAFLKDRRLKVIDKTVSGGALWVIGGSELKPTLDELKKHGARFNFKSGGGRVTHHRDAWWYQPS
jgi:very-short-patch-repair endonuclease